MALSEEKLKQKLERLKRTLTAKQQEFLEVRPMVKSDAQACRQIGTADTTVPKWKQNSNFFTAYVIVTQMLEANRDLLVSDVNRQTVINIQNAALLAFLPKAVQTHFDIINTTKSDEFRLRAIKMIYDYVGIGPGHEPPAGKQSEKLKAVISLIGPQARLEAKKLGLDEEANIADIVAEAKGELSPEALAVAAELDEPTKEAEYDLGDEADIEE